MSDDGLSGSNSKVDTVWLTYGELAAKLGVDLTSVQRRTLQENWPRRPGSDGKARVGVPQEILVDAESTGKAAALDSQSDHVEAMLLLQEQLQAALARLDADVSRLREHAERAWSDAAEARRETMAALQRVMMAELEMAKLRSEMEAAEMEVAKLRRDREAAEETVTRIRARSLWARILNRS